MIWWYGSQLDRIETDTSKIISTLVTIKGGIYKMSAELDALTAQVEQNAAVEATAVALIKQLADELATAVANNDGPALQALSVKLQASASALAAAETAASPGANTANT